MNDITYNQAILRDCILQYSDVMEGLIKNSVRTNREMGMFFYVDKHGDYNIGEICSGTSCSLRLGTDVKNTVGIFHVHPKPGGHSKLSPGDILHSYHYKYIFSCLGTERDGTICFIMSNGKETEQLEVMFKRLYRDMKHELIPHLRYVAKYIHRKDMFFEDLYPRSDIYMHEVVYNIIHNNFESLSPLISSDRSVMYSSTLMVDYMGKIIGREDSRYYDMYSSMYDKHMLFIGKLQYIETFTDVNYTKLTTEYKPN